MEYFFEMWALAMEGEKQGIFFFISLYVLVLAGYSTVYQFKVARWPATKGVLLDAEVQQWGATEWAKSNQEYAATALYKYKVAGKEYQGQRVSPWVIVASHNVRFILAKQLGHIQKNDDGSIVVYFNPGKPRKSFLIKPGAIGLAVTSASAVLPMLLYWLNYYV